MKDKPIFKVVEGDKAIFEKECNELSEEGYRHCGSMTTIVTDIGIIHCQLMSMEHLTSC